MTDASGKVSQIGCPRENWRVNKDDRQSKDALQKPQRLENQSQFCRLGEVSQIGCSRENWRVKKDALQKTPRLARISHSFPSEKAKSRLKDDQNQSQENN